VDIDTSAWSGDGDFTQLVLACLREQPQIAYVRVEDAPASRDDVGYSFISNEVFVIPSTERRREPFLRWGIWRSTRLVRARSLSIGDVEAALTADATVGAPDFSDDTMLQYLRTHRIVPAYQTRGYKLVELVRIYIAAGNAAR
jgi:hypothetical protein